MYLVLSRRWRDPQLAAIPIGKFLNRLPVGHWHLSLIERSWCRGGGFLRLVDRILGNALNGIVDDQFQSNFYTLKY